jgi:deoxyribodipyrimidine photolyase
MWKYLWTELRLIIKTVTPVQAVKHELLHAEHELLQAETGVEYAQALVTYNKNRVKRLKAYLDKTEEVKEPT